MNLKLADSARAEAFANRFDPGGYTNNTGGLYVIPWQWIGNQDGLLVTHEQKILIVGSWLLALLAISSLAVLVGGRMAEQTRRAGLLKAVVEPPLWSPRCFWPSTSCSPWSRRRRAWALGPYHRAAAHWSGLWPARDCGGASADRPLTRSGW